MKIIWSDSALEKVKERMGSEECKVLLKYETDGCGCVVNGVWNIFLVKEVEEGDKEFPTNAMPIYIPENFLVYLDKEIKIDYNENMNFFQLKSPSHYINPTMTCKR